MMFTGYISFLLMSVYCLNLQVKADVDIGCFYSALCYLALRVKSTNLSLTVFLKHMYASDDISFVYGHQGVKLSPTLATFVNGVAVSIDILSLMSVFLRMSSAMHCKVIVLCGNILDRFWNHKNIQPYFLCSNV